MVQVLGGLISYLLMAIYCHEEFDEGVSIKRIRQLRNKVQNELRSNATEVKSNDRIVKEQKKNMQNPNRTPLNTCPISDNSHVFGVDHYPLYMLETFVGQDRFKGTCYRASNWQRVGQTIGTSKKGHKHLKHNRINDIYLIRFIKSLKHC